MIGAAINTAMAWTPARAATIVWQPLTGAWVIVLLIVSAAAFTALAYRRAAGPHRLAAASLGLMRLATLAALAFVLAGPSKPSEDEPLLTRGRVAVMLDTSGSMATADVGDTSRLAALAAQYLSEDRLARLRQRFDVQLYGFDRSIHTLPAAALAANADALPTGSESRYADSLREVLDDLTDVGANAENQPAAIVLLGDGHDTADAPLGPVIDVAKRRGVAVHTVIVGSAESPVDLAVTAAARPATLFVGERGRIVATVRRIGPAGDAVGVRLTGPGVDERRTAVFDRFGAAKAEFAVRREEPGTAEYRVSVEPAPGEAVTANNRQEVFVETARRRASVLMVEGEPHWDTRFLAQVLRLDGRVRLTQITQIAEGRVERLDSGGPTVGDDTEESATPPRSAAQPNVPRDINSWGQYDVVILGRRVGRLMDEASARSLVEWVTQGGGGVIFARGRAWDDTSEPGRRLGAVLGAIEPVNWGDGDATDVQLRATAAGVGDAMVGPIGARAGGGAGDELPALEHLQRAASVRAGAIVLAESRQTPSAAVAGASAGSPVVVEMEVGRGRVLVSLAEGWWRWRLLPESLDSARGLYERMWTGAVRSMAATADIAPGRSIDLRLAAATVRLGDDAMVEVIARGESAARLDTVRLEVTDPAGSARTIEPTAAIEGSMRRRATFIVDRAGVWRVVVVGAGAGAREPLERRFIVYDPSTERLDTAAHPDYLRSLAEETGGLFARCGEPLDLAAELTRRRTAARNPEPPRPLWDRWQLLAGLVMLLAIEWIARRRLGWV